MLVRLLLCLVLTLLIVQPPAMAAQHLRDGYTPAHPVPARVSDVCSDLGPAFSDLRSAIDTSAKYANDASQNAKGLGYWSPPKHFRSVEDDYIVVNKVVEPSLDQATDVPVALDNVPNSAAKDVALALANAYTAALELIRKYANAAVVYERSAHSRQRAQEQNFFGTYATSRNLNEQKMSADEARSFLDLHSDDVLRADRALKLPESRWTAACSNTPKDTEQ